MLEPGPEFHRKEDEEQTAGIRLDSLPDERTLRLENLSFSYDGADWDYVLEDINLTIPQDKVTAIVGASGSGKTTSGRSWSSYTLSTKDVRWWS